MPARTATVRRTRRSRTLAGATMVIALLSPATGARAADGARGDGLRIDVNDTQGIGTVGDARLSLAEAIRIAARTLPLSALSQRERAQVMGAAGGPARIRMALPRGTEILFSNAVLPPLIDLGPTVIDGGGVILVSPTKEQIPDDKPAAGSSMVLTTKRVAFQIGSSDVTIRDFAMRDWVHGLEIRPNGPQGLDHITVTQNSLIGITEVGIEVIGTTRQGGISRIAGLDLSNNIVRGVPKGDAAFTSRAISVQAGGHPTDSASAGSAISDLKITNSTIEGFFSGVYIAGNAGGSGFGGTVTGIKVSDNSMSRCGDTCVTMFTMSPSFKGMHEANGRIADAEISRNHMVSGRSAGVFLWASEAFLGAHASGGVMEHVRITDNEVLGADERRCLFGGVGLWGAFSEMSDKSGLVDGGAVRDLVIDRNRVLHCTVGVAVVAAGTHISDSMQMRNFSVSDVKVRDNDLASNDTGIYLGGAIVRNATEKPLTVASVLSGNSLRNVVVSGNLIRGSLAGMTFYGAESRDVTGASLLNNSLSNVTIAANDIATTIVPCVFGDDKSSGGKPTAMTGNRASVTCPR